MKKKCFKCGNKKQRSEFYSHPQMGDGLLGKCKTCTKSDSAARIEKKKLDPAWMKYERARCREKMNRYRKEGRAKSYPHIKKKWSAENRLKKKAHCMANRAVKKGIIKRHTKCETCGISGVRLEKHHEDYTKPLDVIWLCVKCHGKTKWIDKE